MADVEEITLQWVHQQDATIKLRQRSLDHYDGCAAATDRYFLSDLLTDSDLVSKFSLLFPS